MKKRLPFKCWNCNRKYTLFKEIAKEQELIVQCPYCSMEAVATLNLYEKKTKSVLRGDDDHEQEIGYEYDFPEVIPTQKPD